MAAISAPVSTASGSKNSGTVGDWCWTIAGLLATIIFGSLFPLIPLVLSVLGVLR